MRHPRRLALVLPFALVAAGCAGMRGDAASPTARFAATLEASDPTVDAAIAQMDGFERRALREERAVAFALGRPSAATPQGGPMPVGAAEAAGEVIAPAFTALGDYAHVLALVASGQAADPRPSVGAEVLAQAVAQALPRTAGTIPPGVRDPGIAGVAALAGLAQGASGRGAAAAQDLARQAAPHVAAVTALLVAVIGPQQGQATRGAIRARREAMEAAHARLLDAARRDPGLGASGRYALYHQVAALRDQDPLPGTFTAIVTLLTALQEAHAAIVAGDPATEAKVEGFEAAMARLMTLTGQDQAQAQDQH